MVRSIPEKTLEHWASMHLSYRYRAKAAMWWPADGVDIDVAQLPNSPAKQFWLELKTTEWSKTKHKLEINLWQLWKYGQRSYNPSGIPDYYVFPVPEWNGTITDSPQPWLGALDKTDLGYSSKSGPKWFARWIFVVPGRELRVALATELAAWAAGPRPKKQSVIIATKSPGRSWEWKTKRLGRVSRLGWHEFWELMERCGNGQFGALFALPAGMAPVDGQTPLPAAPSQPPNPKSPAGPQDAGPRRGGPRSRGEAVPVAVRVPARETSRAYLAEQLLEVQTTPAKSRIPLVFYSPNEDGTYRRTEQSYSDALNEKTKDSHRVLITMSAAALVRS